MSDVLGILLTTLYALTFALCVWQFMLAHLNRARLLSFRQSILLLCALWLLLRVIFWAKTTLPTSWPIDAAREMFEIPNCLQFATYMGLLVFEGNIIHRRMWLRFRPWYIAVYIILNLCVWIAILTSYALKTATHPQTSIARPIIVGIAYLLLALLIAVHGWQSLAMSEADRRTLHLPGSLGRSRSRMLILNSVLVVVFFSRGVYDVALQTTGMLPNDLKEVGLDGESLYFGQFLLYCFWEILPVTVLVALIWVGRTPLRATQQSLHAASALSNPLLDPASDDSMGDTVSFVDPARRLPSGPLLVPNGSLVGSHGVGSSIAAAVGFGGAGSLQSVGSATPSSFTPRRNIFDDRMRYDSPVSSISGSVGLPGPSSSIGVGGAGSQNTSTGIGSSITGSVEFGSRHRAGSYGPSAVNLNRYLSPRDILLGIGGGTAGMQTQSPGAGAIAQQSAPNNVASRQE